MTTPSPILITGRRPSEVEGFTSVTAQIQDGASGDYLVANEIVGKPEELEEILAQSEHRMEAIRATSHGIG